MHHLPRSSPNASFLRDAVEVRTAFRFADRAAWFQWRVPRRLAWRRAELAIAGLRPELAGLRILHLSDLHLKPQWCRGYDELIDRVRNDPPDLILFTGDFVDDKFDHRPALPTLRQLVGSLKSRSGIYAIFGNHDPDVLLPYVVRLGVTCLTPQQRLIAPTERGELELIGFPGVWRGDLDCDFIRARPPRAPGLPRIVLCHVPDLFPAALNLAPDVYLAGHTHGGQICLPGGWPLITHDRMPRRFAKGVHRIGRTWYAVSTGVGFASVLPVRLFCPAEVVEFVLVPETT